MSHLFREDNFSALHGFEGLSKTPIDGLIGLQCKINEDERGTFREVVNLQQLESVIGFPFIVRQTNHSRTVEGGIRGIHAEGCNKLVTVANGEVVCAFVDLRTESASFLNVVVACLDNTKAFFIPRGVGNSFYVTHGPADYLYNVDQLYKDQDPAERIAINLFDRRLNIPWPIPQGQSPIFSERDGVLSKTIDEHFANYFAG